VIGKTFFYLTRLYRTRICL